MAIDISTLDKLQNKFEKAPDGKWYARTYNGPVIVYEDEIIGYSGGPVPGELQDVFAAQRLQATGKVVTATTNLTGGIEISTEQSGIASATLVNTAYFDVVPGQSVPTYIGIDGNSSFSWWGLGIMEYTGDLLNPASRRVILASTLLNSAGAAIGSSISIHGAKVLSDGAVLFHVFNSVGNLNYLYLTNTARTSVGANGTTRNDLKPVFELGSRSGTHHANIRTTTIRSLGETFNRNGVRHIWIAEYNVAAGRTSGSTNDFVRVLQSADGGVTWATFLEWNTTASQHYSDHMHGIVQNPYTGWIYFMSGDDKVAGYDERWILAWDGVSAAPALSTPPDQFAATPGWKVIIGSELYRTVDMLCYPTHVAWLCDCDTQVADPASDAFACVVSDPVLTWASRAESIDRVDNIPPALACKTLSGLSVFSAFKNANPSENAYWLWTSGNDGKHWRLAAKIKGYAANVVIGVPWSLYEDPYTGKVLLTGPYAKGVQWGATTQTGQTYILDVVRSDVAVQTFG